MFLKTALQVRKEEYFYLLKRFATGQENTLKMKIYVNICNDENDGVKEKRIEKNSMNAAEKESCNWVLSRGLEAN